MAAQAARSILSKRASRPGESLAWARTCGDPCSRFVNSHLGEEDSPERETLAWARLLSLSDGLSEVAFSLGFSCLLMVELCFIVLLYDGIREVSMHVGRSLFVGNCELGMISIWVVHEKLDTYICVYSYKFGMSNNKSWWLVNQWHGYVMRRNTLLMVGNNELVMIQRMRIEELVMGVGMKFHVWCMWKFLAVYISRSMLVRNSLESLC